MAASMRLGRAGALFALRAMTQSGIRTQSRPTAQIKPQRRPLFLFRSAWAGVAALKVPMPALSPTMEEGNLVKWLKREGDDVAVGDALCEIETDKAVVVLESSDDGVLAKILVQDGSRGVRLGTPIALMVAEGEDWKQVEIPVPEPITPTAAPLTAGHAPPLAHVASGLKQLRLSPAARHILDTHGLDPHLVKPTGPRGLITKEDALKILSRGDKGCPAAAVPVAVAPPPSSAPSALATGRPTYPPLSVPGKPGAPGTFTDVTASSAQRLTQSKSSVPHVYASVNCDLSAVIKLRKQLAAENIEVSVNDFVIRAAAVSLREMPAVSVMWAAEGPQPVDVIHISIAVATPHALKTPIIKDAASKSLQEIAAAAKALAQKARDGKLLPEECQGGSFSICDLSAFGIREFSAVISPPHACVLSVGGARAELRLTDGGLLQSQPLITVTLSSDGRLVDDELASRFLEKFRSNLERPHRASLL